MKIILNLKYDVVLKYIIYVVIAYWLIYAITAPVIVGDSHTYNLARLCVFEFINLFKHVYRYPHTLINVPWTYDAVHLIFVKLKFGYDLPSLSCLVGILLIIYRTVETYFGKTAGMFAALAILTSPTIVYQSTSSKNDIAVVFSLFCWFYASIKYFNTKDRGYLILMSLTLCFACGAKSSGIPFGFLFFICSLILIREKKNNIYFIIFMAIFFTLFASIEIYINNCILYHNLLGPKGSTIMAQKDGILGGVANMLRYMFQGFSLQLYSVDNNINLVNIKLKFYLKNICIYFINLLHITDRGLLFGAKEIDNLGKSNFHENDIIYYNTGGEETADYGFLGGLAIWYSLFYSIYGIRKRDICWFFAVTSIIYLYIFSLLFSFGPWDLRYVMLPYILSITLLNIHILKFINKFKKTNLLFKNIYLSIIIIFVSLTIFKSWGRTPYYILCNIIVKEEVSVIENREVLKLLSDVKYIYKKHSNLDHKIVICAGYGVWLLPYYTADFKVYPIPDVAEAVSFAKSNHITLILFLNKTVNNNAFSRLKLIKSYPLISPLFINTENSLYRFLD